ELTASPLDSDEEGTAGRVLVLHDVSARARLMGELDAYSQTVARDLKSPLQAVVRSLDDVAGHLKLSTEATEYLQRAARICKQMTGTIDALLLFAHLRSTDDVHVEPFHMAAVVD